MKISYNAPVVLTLSLAALAVYLLDSVTPGRLTSDFFSLPGRFSASSFTHWLRLFTWPVGHADWTHLAGNLMMFLLLGPMLEEKHGSARMLEMVLIATVVTAVLNILLFRSGLMGMSGLVFMLIILSSVTNIKAREIPITFLLVAGLYLGREFVDAFHTDRVSQFAHILGGLCGGLFGFVGKGRG